MATEQGFVLGGKEAGETGGCPGLGGTAPPPLPSRSQGWLPAARGPLPAPVTTDGARVGAGPHWASQSRCPETESSGPGRGRDFEPRFGGLRDNPHKYFPVDGALTASQGLGASHVEVHPPSPFCFIFYFIFKFNLILFFNVYF